ncbi:diguanylate cyclase [Aeromonas caviae]|uniref:sensor domain-containing diguanylate cyclase n=1 Tax=Aeromonas caviae TaxID=648 RepID=UPI003A38F9C2
MGDIARQRTSCTLTPLSALLCVAALVLLFSLIGIFTRPPNLLAAFWPANAVLLGCMVRYPRLATPAGWAGGILGFFLAALFTGEPLFKTILLTCGNLAGIGVGYLLMHRLAPADKLLRRPTSLVLLLRNTLAASLAAGVVGAIINPILSLGPPLYGLGFWFASELVNYMTILPVLLTLPPHDSVPPWRTLLYRTEFSWTRLMPLLSLVASLLLTLLIEGPGSIAFPVPALLWCAVTYSVFATSLLTLGYSTLILIALSNGHLVINHDVQTQYWMFSVRIGVMLIALTPLTAASIMAARNSLLREMKHLAHHDHLTGALNRAGFWSAANELLQHLTVQRYPVAICMLDIDHFKRINDRHGHEEGDNQLSGFAARVRDQLRPGDLFCRLGGEEFVAILPGLSEAQAMAVAERLRKIVAQPGEEKGAEPAVCITVSIGIASQREGPFNLDELLSRADQALYLAKHNGRNRVERYSPEQASPSVGQSCGT